MDDQHPEMKPAASARLSVRVQNVAMRELEAFVGAFAAEHGLGAEDEARTLIVLEELLTNVAHYGYPNRYAAEGLAEVVLELAENQLTIEFADDGQAFDPFAKAIPELDQAVESRTVGGLGLHMVRELSDTVAYSRRDGRNVVRLSRRVSLVKASGS